MYVWAATLDQWFASLITVIGTLATSASFEE